MSPARTRLHGFDLVRLVSFFAIATHHISLIHYYTPAINIAERSVFIRAAEQVSRVLAFSGFTVLFLTSILTAYAGNSAPKRVRLFAFLLAGWYVFSRLMGDAVPLVWDIYPLVITGVLTASLVELAGPAAVRGLGLVGFLMLLIPFWEFREAVSLPSSLKLALGFGDCAVDTVEWPVLPWIGLIWCGYWAGHAVRGLGTAGRASYLRLTPREGAVWAVALAASVPQLGSYYGINLGAFFACEAYRQPPLVWWSHFVWPVALLRFSLEPRVQAWLAARRLCQLVSGLAISRKFWLAYIANYLLAHLLSYIVRDSGVEATQWNVPTIAFIAVFFVPATEFLTRGILAVAARLRAAIGRPRLAVAPTGEEGASLDAANQI